MEIVGKLKYTNGLHIIPSLKSELLRRYILFPFFGGTSISNRERERERESERERERESERSLHQIVAGGW